MSGAAQAILDCLCRFGLHWDGEVYYQSQHIDDYLTAISRLNAQQRLYRCICSRKCLADSPDLYPGFCRDANHPDSCEHALRVKTDTNVLSFDDLIQGQIQENLNAQHGDFIIKRKDGIIAYQLAVVVDDHLQGVNHVVRGYDLLDSTARQLFLYRLLDYSVPDYMHIPIIVDGQGFKLSKQTHAQAVDERSPGPTLVRLLEWLKQNPPSSLRRAAVGEILRWATAHWNPEPLKKIHTISSPA